MTPDSNNTTRIHRDARLRWIRISDLKVTLRAQREYQQKWVDSKVNIFRPEVIGNPIVNERDYEPGQPIYVLDGWHRIMLLRAKGLGEKTIQCWTYVGLTEEQEADFFLLYNARISISAFDTFRIAVTANWPVETDIDRIVRTQGLHVSRRRADGGISAVIALRNVYGPDGDANTLTRTLRVVKEAYGDVGFDSRVIQGIGMVVRRYNGQLDDDAAIDRLSNMHGGVNGLLNAAESLHRSTGSTIAQCVAAASVDVINRKRGGKRLPNWWKTEGAS